VLHAPLDFRRRYSQFDVDRNWPNVNLSPDFPTVARVIADQYRQYSGDRVDGVIAIDPIGMAQLMRLTGPLTVPPWPVPLTTQNVPQITLHDEYVAFDSNRDQRIDFLGDVARDLFDALIGHGFNDLLRTGPVMHNLTASHRLQMWSRDAAAQLFFRRTDADGRVAPVKTDAVMVTTQNAAGNKADFFLRRSMKYDSTVRRAGDGVHIDATLRITLRNGAPSSGDPRYVIGPFDARFRAGQNRLFLTAYSPLDLKGASIDGQPLTLSSQPELGRNAYSAFVDIPSRGARVVELRLSGLRPRTRRYVLDVEHQPLAAPDAVELTIRGVGPGGTLVSKGSLNRDLSLTGGLL
jgi:hypothetical protein